MWKYFSNKWKSIAIKNTEKIFRKCSSKNLQRLRHRPISATPSLHVNQLYKQNITPMRFNVLTTYETPIDICTSPTTKTINPLSIPLRPSSLSETQSVTFTGCLPRAHQLRRPTYAHVSLVREMSMYIYVCVCVCVCVYVCMVWNIRVWREQESCYSETKVVFNTVKVRQHA